MNKSSKVFIIIEIQIILLLLVFVIFKMETLDKKVFNTNKFLYEVLKEKKTETLNSIKETDIIIGDSAAPVTMLYYSRFDCSACAEFYYDNYQKLKSNYIDNGKVKLIIRYLVHSSKPHTLYATKCAYFAQKKGVYDSYIKNMNDMYPNLDTLEIKKSILSLVDNEQEFYDHINDVKLEKSLLQLANKARKSGITSTPTLFINNQQLIGNRRFKKIEEIILFEL